MRHRVFSFALLTLILGGFISIQAQTPNAALDRYKDGLKKSDRQDFDGAIEDFSRAIVLSSRLSVRKEAARSSVNSFAGVDDSENIHVIDPFTANAYNNRGYARYHKGDVMGAIEDFNAALRIRPGLVIAYLNRAAALQLNGDSAGAMKDLDKAVSLKKD